MASLVGQFGETVLLCIWDIQSLSTILSRNVEREAADMDRSGRAFDKARTRPVWSALRRLVSWPFRVAAARRALRQLAGMSERELADISLARQDLRDASALPLGDDPTRIFAMRIEERRRR
jgi:uncharacterized protein YjiS (DUF1127 family)